MESTYLTFLRSFQELAKAKFGDFSMTESTNNAKLGDKTFKILYKGLSPDILISRHPMVGIHPFNDFVIEERMRFGIRYLIIKYENELEYDMCVNFLATKKGDLHKLILRCRKEKETPKVPILNTEDYNSTIGEVLRFIKNRKKIKAYGITTNKGILIWGKPGNGKTLVSSYIRDVARDKGLSVNIVNMSKIAKGTIVGDILIMDDFSIEHLIKRTDTTDALLQEMDGPNKEGGRIYIITTNELEKASDVYGALVRPGRIDTVVQLRMPNAELRRKYIESWTIKLNKDQIEQIVTNSVGWSFAELNFLQTEIVMTEIEGHPINITIAMDKSKERAEYIKEKKGGMGFVTETAPTINKFEKLIKEADNI